MARRNVEPNPSLVPHLQVHVCRCKAFVTVTYPVSAVCIVILLRTIPCVGRRYKPLRSHGTQWRELTQWSASASSFSAMLLCIAKFNDSHMLFGSRWAYLMKPIVFKNKLPSISPRIWEVRERCACLARCDSDYARLAISFVTDKCIANAAIAKYSDYVSIWKFQQSCSFMCRGA